MSVFMEENHVKNNEFFGYASMENEEYFSLLFPNLEQMESTFAREDTRITYKNTTKTRKSYHFVGTRMVMEEEKCCEDKEEPCFYKDLNLKLLEPYLEKEQEKESSLRNYKMLLLATDIDTISYRQDILKDLEKKQLLQCLKDYCVEIEKCNQLVEKAVRVKEPFLRGKYLAEVIITINNAIDSTCGIIHGYKMIHKVKSKGISELLHKLHQIQNDIGASIVRRADILQMKSKQLNWKMVLENANIEVSFLDYEEQRRYDYIQGLAEILEVENTKKDIYFGYSAQNSSLASIFQQKIMENSPDLVNMFADFSQDVQLTKLHLLNQYKEELAFYIGASEMVFEWKKKGFSVTYPMVENRFQLQNICELGLVMGDTLEPVVLNSVQLEAEEKGVWITGKNHGGKTTLLKAIGQIVYLTLLGLPVIGTKVSVPFVSGIFTHFSMEENEVVSNGKLVEELNHLKEIKTASKAGTLFILNEMFSSTTILDGMNMSELFIKKAISDGQYVVCVTHIPQLVQIENKMKHYAVTAEYHIVEGVDQESMWDREIFIED